MADITSVVRATDAVTISPGSGISITESGSPGSKVYTIANTGGGGGAPTNAQYVVLATDATLTDERQLAVDGSLSMSDAGAGSTVTLGIKAGGVGNAELRDSGALSVIGRAANSAGDPADISASAASDAVLRESGSTVGFGTIATGGIANDAVTYAKMQNVSAASKLLGRGDSGSGDPQEITLGTNLSITGTTINATGGGAPTTAEYLVGALDGGLSAERLVTDTATVSWDLATAGAAKASIVAASITDTHVAAANKDGVAGTASMRTLGTGAQQACGGTDARLSDARTPLAHTHAAADIASGTIATARLGTGTADATTFLRGDQTWAAPTGGSGLTYPQVLSAAWMLG